MSEPSIVKFGEKYLMTIRHEYRSCVTSSDEGLHYDALKRWRFDDGEELGNYNSQQKWLKGRFSHSKEGQRFWIDNENINYIQYIGDLLLAFP